VKVVVGVYKLLRTISLQDCDVLINACMAAPVTINDRSLVKEACLDGAKLAAQNGRHIGGHSGGKRFCDDDCYPLHALTLLTAG
jgi:hypothetical protein